MFELPELNYTFTADFVSSWLPSGVIEHGPAIYTEASAAYSTISAYNYANQIYDSGKFNLNAVGNMSLSLLSIPGAKESISALVESYTGIDEESYIFYLINSGNLLERCCIYCSKDMYDDNQ